MKRGWLKKLFKKSKKPLTTNSLAFSYSTQEVLRDISLNLKKGEIVAIIGKSGSGKSTFLKILSGIISTNYRGKIKIFGSPKLFKKHQIGFVPQEPALIPDLSIEDNIKIAGLNSGISESKALENADQLLKQLKLTESILKKPSEISGGQKVRLNIILSLLHDPKILILDEPFVGLDFPNRRLLWHFLERMRKKGKSIIITSHLLTETQEHASRLVILQNGRVLFTGNIEKLKQKLKIQFILELRLNHLSQENLEKIKKFCAFKDIKILDIYEKFLMFSLESLRQKNTIDNLLNKLQIQFQEVSFREPNLDEIFMKTNENN